MCALEYRKDKTRNRCPLARPCCTALRLAEKQPHLFTLQGTPILSLDNTFKVDVGSSSALRIACLLFA